MCTFATETFVEVRHLYTSLEVPDLVPGWHEKITSYPAMPISAEQHAARSQHWLYTFTEGRLTLVVDFESGNPVSVLNSFSSPSTTGIETFDCQHLLPIPSTCLQKYMHHSSSLSSLPTGRILRTFSVSSSFCILRCLSCAARCLCTKLNVKSSYNHIER